MNKIILQTLKKMRKDYGSNEMIIFAQDSDLQVVANEIEKAINYSQCCKSDSEQLTCDTCKHNCLVWDDEHPCATCAGMDNYVAG